MESFRHDFAYRMCHFMLFSVLQQRVAELCVSDGRALTDCMDKPCYSSVY